MEEMLGKKVGSNGDTVLLKQSTSREQEQSLIEPFDEEEFTKLDNKIKEG